MKKLLALFVVVVAAISVTASVAVAAPGTGVPTVHFTAAYGPFTCKGDRITTSGTNASVREQETCSVAGQFLAEGKYAIGAVLDFANFKVTWYSDLDGIQAVSGTIMVKNRPDGTSVWQINATY